MPWEAAQMSLGSTPMSGMCQQTVIREAGEWRHRQQSLTYFGTPPIR